MTFEVKIPVEEYAKKELPLLFKKQFKKLKQDIADDARIIISSRWYVR